MNQIKLWRNYLCCRDSAFFFLGPLQFEDGLLAIEVQDLIVISGVLNSEEYRQMLIHHALTSGRCRIAPTSTQTHDNEPKHRVTVIKNHLQWREQGVLQQGLGELKLFKRGIEFLFCLLHFVWNWMISDIVILYKVIWYWLIIQGISLKASCLYSICFFSKRLYNRYDIIFIFSLHTIIY